MKGGCKLVYYCSTPGCYNEGEAHGDSVSHAENLLRGSGWNTWREMEIECTLFRVYSDTIKVDEFLCPPCFEAWKKEHS